MVARAERLLFAPVDARAAAWFRVALAAMLAAIFWRSPWRTMAGWDESPLLEALAAHVFLTRPYLALVLVLLGVFAAGWAARAVGLLLVVLLFPLYLANPQLSGRLLLVTLLLLSMLRGGRTSRPGADPAAFATAGPMWPIRLIQLDLTLVYAVNALAKTTPAYLSGDVLVGMSRMLPNFVADLSDGRWHVGSFALPVAVLAIGSVVTEYFLAVGFWVPRLRAVAAVTGIGFHLLARRFVTIGMLDWVCVFSYLAFLLPFERGRAHSADQRVTPAR